MQLSVVSTVFGEKNVIFCESDLCFCVLSILCSFTSCVFMPFIYLLSRCVSFVDYSILSQRVNSSRDDSCQIEPIFFDVETTGLGSNAEILQISASRQHSYIPKSSR